MKPDTRERRYGRPGDTECNHVWRPNQRRIEIRASFGECEIIEDRTRAYTNDERHREWAIYVCMLCDLREALEVV